MISKKCMEKMDLKRTKTITDFGTIIEINNDFAIIECKINNENILIKRKIYKNLNNQYITIRGEKIFL